MKDKIEFVKWILKEFGSINWLFIGFIIHQILASVLMFTLETPYDMWAVWYEMFLIVIGFLYFFIIYPLQLAYERFLEQK